MSIASIRHFPQRGAVAVAVFGLSLAISCTATVVVALDRLVLRPFPMADLRRVVFLGGLGDHPTKDAVEWWSRSGSLEELAHYTAGTVVLNSGGEDAWIQAAFVSPAFFRTFGIRPTHGRSFVPEDVSSGSPVAVVAQHFARSRMGGPAAALGRDLRVNGLTYRVVGVMPDGFTFPGRTDIWLPRPGGPTASLQVRAQLMETQSPMLAPSEAWIAKLRSGVTRQQAQQELLALLRVLDKESRPKGIRAGTLAFVRAFHDVHGRSVRPTLVLLLVGGLFLLAAAVVSCSSILLGVALQRQTHFALRQALGASFRQIFSQIVSESSALGVLSAAFASVVTLSAGRTIDRIVRSYIPDAPDLAVGAALVWIPCLVAGLMAGSLMAIPNIGIVVRSAPAAILQGRLEGGHLGYRLRKALTISQVAIAFALGVAGFTSIAAYERARSTDSGVRPENLLWFRLGIRGQLEGERYGPLLEEVLHVIGNVQGVAKAAVTDSVWWLAPGAGGFRFVIYQGQPVMCLSTAVRGQYFGVTGIRLKSGSDFSAVSEREVIVDEEFVRRMGGEQGVLGQPLRLDGEAEPRTIIGIAQHVSAFGGERSPEPQCYFPLSGRFVSSARSSTIEVLVRCTAGCPGVVPAIREELQRVPGVSLYAVVPIAEGVHRAFAPLQVQALLLGVYAFVSGALALAGLYGVLSTVFAARRREMAVRVAVGATTTDVITAVWKEGAGLTAAGVVAGGVLAVGLGTVVSSQIFQMRSPDLAVLLGGAVAFLVTATLATLPVALCVARQQSWEILKAE